MLIRPHARPDADRLADILAAGWKQAYAHFMPAAFLAPRIDPAYRRAEIADWLDKEFDPGSEALFVAEHGGDIAGFIHVIIGDKGDVGATGHVSLLYVDPAQQRRGFGRALMAEGVRWLMVKAPGPLALSAFAANPYRQSYNALGGQEAVRLKSVLDGTEVEAVIYLWPDPSVLLG